MPEGDAAGANGLKEQLTQRQNPQPQLVPPPQKPTIVQQASQATTKVEESGVLSKRKVQDLVSSVSPGDKLDPEVEEVLLEIAEDFVENVTNFSCLLAKHRKSTVLEVQDISLHLEKHWGIKVAGYSGAEERAAKKANTAADAQKKALAARPPGAGGGAGGSGV